MCDVPSVDHEALVARQCAYGKINEIAIRDKVDRFYVREVTFDGRPDQIEETTS
jgi:hypothetical protein